MINYSRTSARYQARGVRPRGRFCGNLPALGQHCRDLGPTLPSDGKRYDRYSEPFFSFTIHVQFSYQFQGEIAQFQLFKGD